MGVMVSRISSLTIVYSTVYSGADQSSASLAFVWGIHRWPVNSPHKWAVTRKMFPGHFSSFAMNIRVLKWWATVMFLMSYIKLLGLNIITRVPFASFLGWNGLKWPMLWRRLEFFYSCSRKIKCSNISHSSVKATFDYDMIFHMVKHGNIQFIFSDLDMRPHRGWVCVVVSYTICKDWLHARS